VSTAQLLIELGTEELPARFARPAIEGFRDALLELLAGLPRGEVRTYVTPRRLAVVIDDLATHQPTAEKEVLGPPADKAFTGGVPNETGIAFARGKGADPATLRIVEVPKRGPVAAITVVEGGAAVADLLSTGLAAVLAKIPFARSMRWADGTFTFGRPLRRVVVVFGGDVVAGSAHGFAFSGETNGHRLSPEPFPVTDAAGWLAGLRAHHVEPDRAVRRARVVALLAEAATAEGCDPVAHDDLLEEVVDLVEWPVGVVGTFDADLLELPPRLLVTSMRVHQRYFPLHRAGMLTNRFVVVANNPFANVEVVAEGNARVLRARFYDARFFLREDLAKPLTTHAEKLLTMRWIKGLGTMADRGERLATLGAMLAEGFGADASTVRTAAMLAKADLGTQMVGEFPELQGHVGRLYAARQGVDEAAAVAVEEHYLPRFAGDATASTPAGRALAAAERLDVLVGCFGVGLEPKGGGDPQGLRRAALGLVHTLIAAGWRGDLDGLFQAAVGVYHQHATGQPGFEGWTSAMQGASADPAGLGSRLAVFTLARFKAWQVDLGRSADLVDAILAVGSRDVVDLGARLEAFAGFAGTEQFATILQTFKRVMNILDQAEGGEAFREALVEPEALALFDAATAVQHAIATAESNGAWSDALHAVADLTPSIQAFFDGLLVNDPDATVRARRQGTLVRVANLLGRVADFRRISTR